MKLKLHERVITCKYNAQFLHIIYAVKIDNMITVTSHYTRWEDRRTNTGIEEKREERGE